MIHRRSGALVAAAITIGLAGSAAATTADADPDKGKALFQRYCAGCHGMDGRGGAHTFMPHVGNLTRKDYVELLPDEHLHQVIMEGGPSVGLSSYMPAWQATLNVQDVRDIIAHIRRLARY
jgi:mono/diheme cytochrome c family protein